MSRRAPVQVIRAQARADCADAFSSALAAEDVTQIDVAAATGALRAVVQRWGDRNEASTVSLADVVVIGASYPSVARRLLGWAAARLGYDLRPHASTDPGERTGVALVHGMLDAIRLATEHDADGVISEAEARAELEVLDSFDEVSAARRARLRMALGATARA